MAWTTPRTWSTGDTATASMMNNHVRDNTSYLYDQPMAMTTNTQNTTIQAATSNPISLAFGTTIVQGNGILVTASQFTPMVVGIFEVWIQVAWSGSVSGHRTLFLISTGASGNQIVAADTRNAVALGVAIFQSCSGTTPIVDGATNSIFVDVVQDSSGSQTLFGSGTKEPITNLPYASPVFGIKMLGSGA